MLAMLSPAPCRPLPSVAERRCLRWRANANAALLSPPLEVQCSACLPRLRFLGQRCPLWRWAREMDTAVSGRHCERRSKPWAAAGFLKETVVLSEAASSAELRMAACCGCVNSLWSVSDCVRIGERLSHAGRHAGTGAAQVQTPGAGGQHSFLVAHHTKMWITKMWTTRFFSLSATWKKAKHPTLNVI